MGYMKFPPFIQSKKKNHLFSKFSIFRWLSRAHQELSFKKNSREKCFFCADLWSAKVFSLPILSYLIRMPLLNQANHAISQKSWSTSIVFTVFPWTLEWMPPKKKKALVPFRPRLQDERRRQNKAWKRRTWNILSNSAKQSKQNRIQTSPRNVICAHGRNILQFVNQEYREQKKWTNLRFQNFH